MFAPGGFLCRLLLHFTTLTSQFFEDLPGSNDGPLSFCIDKQEETQQYKVVCYYNGQCHDPSKDPFQPKYIDTDLCTHINYAFATIKDGVLQASSPDDEPSPGRKGCYQRVTDLKKRKPTLKVLLSVGGWGMLGPIWDEVVVTEESRQRFIDHAVHFLTNRSFDGLDIDWEYPTERGSGPEDKEKFTLLLKGLRQRFDLNSGNKSGRLLVTAATAANRGDIDVAYDIPEISKYLDYINLMAYDFHGYIPPDQVTTGIHSPLYPPAGHPNDTRCQDKAVNYWLSKGAPASHLVLGMGLYGRTFTLADPQRHGIGANATGPGVPGGGWRSYRDIAADLKTGKWTFVWRGDMKSCYSYRGKQWVGFDIPRSIRMKAEYVKTHGLAGAMVWSVDQDDFRGSVSGGQKYPMLTAINDVLNN